MLKIISLFVGWYENGTKVSYTGVRASRGKRKVHDIETSYNPGIGISSGLSDPDLQFLSNYLTSVTLSHISLF